MFDSIPEGWIALLLLGAFHGVNPGMGWLFAVALGLQEGSGRAVWRALPPLIAGHALAVATAIALGALLGVAIGSAPVRWVLAATLVTMGILHLRRAWHPRFGGMRVGGRDLVVWSFLMATGHGAGLMALAFIPMDGDVAQAHAVHVSRTAASVLAAPSTHAGHAISMAGGDAVTGLLAGLVHTLGYLLTTVLLAAIVFHRLGLRLLQRGWLNLDVLWAGALVLTGLVILVA
jgi:hypothetical protein